MGGTSILLNVPDMESLPPMGNLTARSMQKRCLQTKWQALSRKYQRTGLRRLRVNGISDILCRQIAEYLGHNIGTCALKCVIKLGLVPYGEIVGQKEDSPTLTYNTINRHISKMVYTKVVTNLE